LCSACKEGDHVNCGMQTWCECECDPEAIMSDPFPDPDTALADLQEKK